MDHIVDISEVLLELGLSSSVTEEERAIVAQCIKKAERAVRRYLGYDPTQRQRTEFYPRADLARSARQAVWETSDTQAYQRLVSEASTDELQVQHLPIRSYPAIDLRIDYDGRSGTQSGAFASGTQKTEGTDYWPNYDTVDSDGYSVCRDGIIRSFGLWPVSAGSVKIVYTAGYTAEELHGDDTIIDAGSIVDAVISETTRRAKGIFTSKKSSVVGHLAGVVTSERLGDYSYTIDAAMAKAAGTSSNDLTAENMERLQDFVNLGFQL